MVYAGWHTIAKIPYINRVYVESFRHERERDFGALDASIASGENTLEPGRGRIRGACSIIGAFAAWYGVARAIAFAAPLVSAIIGTIVGGVLILQSLPILDQKASIVAAASSLVSVAVIYIASRYLRFYRMARFFFAAAAVTLLGVAWSWIRQPQLPWLLPPWAASLSSCATLLLFFSISIAIVRWATLKKTTLYPDDEVLQSLLAAFVGISDDKAWTRAATRRPLSAALEWIARRLEREMIDMFAGPGGNIDDSVTSAGARRAAAVRAWKTEVAFPKEDTRPRLYRFLIDELASGSIGRWADFVETDVAPGKTHRTFVDFLLPAGRALLPIAIASIFGFIVVRIDSAAADIVEKAVLIAGVWSFLGLLRGLDPQGFDAQLEAAKSLKDIV